MTVKELRKKLKGLPPNMEIMVQAENTEYGLGLLDEAKVRRVTFKGEKVEPKENCLVLEYI